MPALDAVDLTLRALIAAHARCGWDTWIDEAADLRVVFPAVSRHVGRDGLDAPGATLTAATGDVVSLAAWRLDDAARTILLRRSGTLEVALELYRTGDAREKCGVSAMYFWAVEPELLTLVPCSARSWSLTHQCDVG